jgi:lipoprotein-anchoring transpeptidase ErfK/SrfK
MSKLSRRTLIKAAGSSLLSAPLILIAKPKLSHAAPLRIEVQPVKRPFGRAIQGNWIVREQPSTKAEIVRKLKRNEVIPLLAQATSDESPSAYNKIWYQTADGWVHSAYIQPSEEKLNPVLPSIDPKTTLWGELTVPLSPARVKPDPDTRAPWTHYYGTTHQVLEVVEGVDKKPWYRISDGILQSLHVPAEHIRIIQPDEFTPISPDVPLSNKRIDVDLKNQMVRAYENDTEVFSARCATGAAFRQADGTVRSFRTIPGEHRVYLKTPSQRMYGGAGDGDSYDLPGIAWISYFTASGIAFHSTYWHNDYGKPRSHGCVNLLPEDAKWTYRWTMPATPYEQRWTRVAKRDEGSLVKVF